MSYCRWSSDNWKSDVYVYEGDCWVIHVAGRRRARAPIPELPLGRLPMFGAAYDDTNPPQLLRYPSRLHGWAHRVVMRIWMWSHRLHMWDLSRIPLVPICGQYDGETFYCASQFECWTQLCVLRSAGYHVPQFALDQLLAESAER